MKKLLCVVLISICMGRVISAAEEKFDADDSPGVYGITNLMMAANRGNIGEAKKFLGRGELLDATDDWGNTALAYAVSIAQREMCEFFLGKGASLSMGDDESVSKFETVIELVKDRIKEYEEEEKIARTDDRFKEGLRVPGEKDERADDIELALTKYKGVESILEEHREFLTLCQISI